MSNIILEELKQHLLEEQRGALADIKTAVEPIIEHELAAIHEFTARLIK